MQFFFTEIDAGRLHELTPENLIHSVDMSDCCDFMGEIASGVFVYDPKQHPENPTLQRVQIHGIWHNPNDPLYIKVTLNGQVVASGYGTDH